MVSEARKIHSQERGVLIDLLRVIAKLAGRFPLAIQYLRDGRTSLSHLAIMGDKMTQANELVIWDNILDKERREVEDFLRRVQPDGTVKQQADEMISLQITVTAEQDALIHRLTEVLSARSHVPTTAEAIMTAVEKLLDQRDQLRWATKMAAKDAGREVMREGQVRDDEVLMDEAVSGQTRMPPLPRGCHTREIRNTAR